MKGVSFDKTDTLVFVDNEDYKNNVQVDSFTAYMNGVARIPMLSKQEELALLKLAKRGDMQAKKTLIESNLRLVVSIARRFQGRGLDLEDLASEGNIGLMHAIDKFDPDKGFRLSTYATPWIIQHIQKAVGNKGRAIRIPYHLHIQVKKIVDIMKNSSSNAEAFKKMQKDMGISKNEAERLLLLSEGVNSLNMPVGAKLQDEVMDFIPDSDAISTEDQIEQKLMAESVHKALEQLTERERKIIGFRYGFADDGDYSYERVGELVGLSREGVRKNEKKALEKLRNGEYVDVLKEYVS